VSADRKASRPIPDAEATEPIHSAALRKHLPEDSDQPEDDRKQGQDAPAGFLRAKLKEISTRL
jgi:hypothetical protein